MKKILIIIFTIPFVALGQSVHFSAECTWAQVLSKAKAENKHIFVDVYATWCAPCKFMTDSIFNKAEAGEYMNANFINYQVQTDRVDKDGPDRKAKYEEAKQLATKYKISGLPTMLFFSPDGDLLDEQVGSLTDVSTFLERVKKAIDPREQYYKLLEQYYNGTKDNLFLIKLITLARALDDRKTLAEIEKQINQK